MPALQNTSYMNKYEKDYVGLLKDILHNPDTKDRENRTESKTIMAFGKSLEVDLRESFPILQGRKMFPKTFFTELKWFLEGETNIQRFKDAGVSIWNLWADDNGDLGPVYGHQLRKFNYPTNNVDQLAYIIDKLKSDPHDRRMVVSLWNPVQLDEMKLPPCYHTFTFCVTNGELNIDIAMRSSDVFVGLPYDVALFATMNTLICKEVGLKPGRLKFNLADAHIYWDNRGDMHEYIWEVLGLNKESWPKLNIPEDQTLYNFEPENLEITEYLPVKYLKVKVVK